MAEKSFEEKMLNLELIKKDLEKDDLSLDDAVKKFEDGMKISRECREILDNAEKKITILLEGEEKDFVQS
ncbi:MAG: exodeoxyribonuclease VII small subunit [Clostridiales bacterium]|jgi:exodeoxyribonuclease VII, small subunit|nr:exodeoxyribonuclease VII small subunit [Clostridiales bacterium]MBF0926549.1 exodeoxyribonuclease VII small subunit [Clostridiales bacterium]MBF0986104.1 exodeoxyribonuclease VII small subunit [Clostridiales bacterium]